MSLSPESMQVITGIVAIGQLGLFLTIVNLYTQIMNALDKKYLTRVDFAESKTQELRRQGELIDRLYSDINEKLRHYRDNANTVAQAGDELVAVKMEKMMEKIEAQIHATLAQSGQKVDDLVKRFDRFEDAMPRRKTDG